MHGYKMNTFGMLIILVFTTFIANRECLRFEDNFDGFSDEIFVNNSETATIKFKYNPGQDKQVLIKCGSLDADGKFTPFVSKATLTSDWTTTGALSGRVKVLKDSTDKNIIGFTISSVRKTDPSKYRCDGSYNDVNNVLQDPLHSTVVTLTVLDPPKLEDCLLGDLPDKKVGESLEIACYATGKPVPYLRCLLLDDDKKQLKQLSNSQTGNLTKGDWEFKKVPREARYVQCIASHTQTGSTNITKPFQVLHAPPAVENFTQISSPVSSITFEWSPMSERYAGGIVTSYIIRYYPTKKGQVSSVRKELTGTPTNDPDQSYKKNDDVYTYEISELTEYEEYKVSIIAKNSNGEGETTTKEMKTGYKPVVGGSTDGDDSNLGPIIGGVIGGVVLIILIVILIVWLSKRKSSTGKSNYPMSYVEDAVDYPPNQGNNLYAGVDSKQRKSQSDYGDGYNGDGTQDYSYETSDKAYV